MHPVPAGGGEGGALGYGERRARTGWLGVGEHRELPTLELFSADLGTAGQAVLGLGRPQLQPVDGAVGDVVELEGPRLGKAVNVEPARGPHLDAVGHGQLDADARGHRHVGVGGEGHLNRVHTR